MHVVPMISVTSHVLVVAEQTSGGEGIAFRYVPQRCPFEQEAVDIVAATVSAGSAGSGHRGTSKELIIVRVKEFARVRTD